MELVFGYGQPCAKSPFDSWAWDKISSKGLNKSYLNKGRTTISLIGAKYCTAGCEHWVSLVTQFYSTELHGDTRNLGLSSIDTSGCTGPNPNPECAPATCENFVSCTGGVGEAACGTPVCASTAGGGGVCLEGSTSCSSLSGCTTSTDCPDGGICAVNTCCGTPVCIPRNTFCSK